MLRKPLKSPRLTSKAREDLKEAARARDSAAAGLTGAQKQAEEQTKRLLVVYEQLQITKK